VPVWVKLDCAYRADDRVVVADWKTGASRPEHRTQLEVYALYAVRTWKDVVPEDLVLRGVYLDDGKEVDAAVSAGDLEELEARVVDSVARMREALEDPEENVAREEAFPMTDERRTCRYCVFRDLCGLGPVTSG